MALQTHAFGEAISENKGNKDFLIQSWHNTSDKRHWTWLMIVIFIMTCILTWCIPTFCMHKINHKSVNIWTQLVIKAARE